MDMLDLDGQTAPESTHGLFDSPAYVANKRNSMLESSNHRLSQQDCTNQSMGESATRHRRNWRNPCDSSFVTLPTQKGRPTSMIESGGYVGAHNFHQPHPNRNVENRSSTDIIHLTGHSNELHNMRATHDGRDTADYSFLRRPRPASQVPRSAAFDYGYRVSGMVMQPGESGNYDHENEEEEENEESCGKSRADVLAEAEAKLNGTYPRPRQYDGTWMQGQSGNGSKRWSFRGSACPPTSWHSYNDKSIRRLSEPHDTALSNDSYSSKQPPQYRSLYQSKHQSLQYMPADKSDQPRWQTRPMTMHADQNRRQSWRQGNEWRSSMISTSSASNRSSVNFTSNRFSFSREDNVSNQRRTLFTAHLPYSAVMPHLKSRQLVSGILRVNKRNRSDAHVFCEELNSDIYICGSRDRNRALDGDRVAIKVVEVDKVIREKMEKEEAKLARNNGVAIVRWPDEEDEKEIIFSGEDDTNRVKPHYCGIVVAVLEREHSQMFSGTLGLKRPNHQRQVKSKHDSSDEQQRNQRDNTAPRIVWFKPVDKRVPLVAIPIEQGPAGFVENPSAFENILFLGSIKRWPITSLHPFGVLEEKLGHSSDRDVQLRSILADNHFVCPTHYPTDALRCVPSTPWIPSSELLTERRHIPSAQCWALETDNDIYENALSISRCNDKMFEVGLHVSDLTVFVKPHTPLDREGRARAVNVGNSHVRIPLWPDELVKECASLVPDKDRLAFSVVWKIHQDGSIVDTWVGKTVVRPCGILKLDDMAFNLDKNKVYEKESCEEYLFQLGHLAEQIRQSRKDQGALCLPYHRLDVELVSQRPKKINVRSCNDRYSLLNEYLLLAETHVAQMISRHCPQTALLVTQSPPNERRLQDVVAYLGQLGISVNKDTAHSIQQSIDNIREPQKRLVSSTFIEKALTPPKLVCAGTLEPRRHAHFTHHQPTYTYFSSPLKRYADLIVHRQLSDALSQETRYRMEQDMIQKIAQHCSIKQLGSNSVVEQTQQFFLCEYLNSQPSTQYEAIVVCVQERTLDVLVPDLSLERRVHLVTLPLRTSRLDKDQLHLYWRAGVSTINARTENDKEQSDDGGQACDSSSATQCAAVPLHESTDPSSRTYDPISNNTHSTLRALDHILVHVIADPSRSPPLLRVLPVNPFMVN